MSSVTPQESLAVYLLSPDAYAIRGRGFPPGIGRQLYGLHCNGSERNLTSCRIIPTFRFIFCTHNDDAGVLCQREPSNLGLLSSCTIDSLHGACEGKESGSVFGAAEHKIHTTWKQYIDSYQKINGNIRGVSLFR